MAQRTPLMRCRVSVEPSGSFGVDRTGSMGNFADVRFVNATMSRTDTVLEDEGAVQRIHQRRRIRHGFKRATLEMNGHLVPLAAQLDAAATPGQDSLASMLESMTGGRNGSSAGSTVAASPAPTTTGFTVASGHGSRFTAGKLVFVETGASSGRYEMNRVASVSTDALTFAWAFSFTPVSTARVLNSDMVFPGTLTPDVCTSLQFLVEGEDRDLIWLARGCQGTLGIEWPLGGLPMWSSQFQAANWTHDDDIATPQGGSPLALATLPGGTPVPVTAGNLILAPTGGTTRVTPTVAEVTFNLGLNWQPVDSFNGHEGIAQYALTRGERATCSMLILADDESWSDIYAAGTTYRMACQAGNAGGGLLGFEMPMMELIAEPTIEDRNGLSWWRLQWGALEDSTSTDQTTDIRRAIWRLARG